MCLLLTIIIVLWLLISVLMPVFGFAGLVVKYWWIGAAALALWLVCCFVYGLCTSGKGEE